MHIVKIMIKYTLKQWYCIVGGGVLKLEAGPSKLTGSYRSPAPGLLGAWSYSLYTWALYQTIFGTYRTNTGVRTGLFDMPWGQKHWPKSEPRPSIQVP
jgi:hypothetical protein